MLERVVESMTTNVAGLTGGIGLSIGTFTAAATGAVPPGIDPALWAVIGLAGPALGVAFSALTRVLRARRKARAAAEAVELERRAAEKQRRGDAKVGDKDPSNDAEGERDLDEASRLRVKAATNRGEVEAIEREERKEHDR